MVNIIDNLCTKQENSSIKSVVYIQERLIIKSGLQSREAYNGVYGSYLSPNVSKKPLKNSIMELTQLCNHRGR